MKRVVPFFPILAAAFPVVAMYSQNAVLVPLHDLWRPLFVAMGAMVVLWSIYSLIFWSIAKGALISLLSGVMFFAYMPIRAVIDSYEASILEPAVFIIAVVLLVRTRRNLATLIAALNIGAISLVAIPCVQLAFRHSPPPRAAYLPIDLPALTKPVRPERPDIYFVVVDGYGRDDQLRRVMGYDNTPFLNELRGRGFFVADRSRSNYCQTQLSLAATLNLSFLQQFPEHFPAASRDRTPLVDAMKNCYLASYLKGRGYSTISVTSGFDEVAFGTDVAYSRALQFTMLEAALIQLTPLMLTDAPTSFFLDRRRLLNGAFANVEKVAATPGPKLVLVHIIAPHPPFVFDARGNPIRQQGASLGFVDGSDYMSGGGTPQMYIEGYSGQIQWVNQRLSEMLAHIIPSSGPQPVIVIEGDHGSKVGLDQSYLEKTDVRECFSNLVAVYAPRNVQKEIYPEMSSVNTFRILLRSLFGETIANLPDRSYYSPFNEPYRFTEVTGRINP